MPYNLWVSPTLLDFTARLLGWPDSHGSTFGTSYAASRGTLDGQDVSLLYKKNAFSPYTQRARSYQKQEF